MGSVVTSVQGAATRAQTSVTDAKDRAVMRTVQIKDDIRESVHSSVQRQRDRMKAFTDGCRQTVATKKIKLKMNIDSFVDGVKNKCQMGKDRLIFEAKTLKNTHVTPHRLKVFRYTLLSLLAVAVLIPTVMISVDVYYGDYETAHNKIQTIVQFIQHQIISLFNCLTTVCLYIIHLLWSFVCSVCNLIWFCGEKILGFSQYSGSEFVQFCKWALPATFDGLIVVLHSCFRGLVHVCNVCVYLFQNGFHGLYHLSVNLAHMLKYLLINLYDVIQVVSVHLYHGSAFVFEHCLRVGHHMMLQFSHWSSVAAVHLWHGGYYLMGQLYVALCQGGTLLWQGCTQASVLTYEYLCLSWVYIKIGSHHLYEAMCVASVYTKDFFVFSYQQLCVASVHLKHLMVYLYEMSCIGWVHFRYGSEVALLFAYDMSCQGAVHFAKAAKISAVYASEYSYRAAVFTWEWSKILSYYTVEGIYYGSIYTWQFSQDAYVYLGEFSQEFNKHAEAWSKMTLESASEALVRGLEWSQVTFENLANASYQWSVYLSEKSVIYAKEFYVISCKGMTDFIEFSNHAMVSFADFMLSAGVYISETSQNVAHQTYTTAVSSAEWTSDVCYTCYDNVASMIASVTAAVLTTSHYILHICYEIWGFVFPWSCFIIDFLYYVTEIILTFTYKWLSFLIQFLSCWSYFVTTKTAKVLHVALNKCFVRGLCIILVTLLQGVYMLFLQLLHFIGFLFYIVFLFLQEIFSYILGGFYAVIGFFYKTVALVTNGFKFLLRSLVGFVKVIFALIIFVLRHLIMIYVYVYGKYCSNRETIFLMCMGVFNLYYSNLMSDRKRAYIQMIQEEQDVVDGRKKRRNWLDLLDTEPDFGLRLLLAETESEREEIENFLREMEIEINIDNTSHLPESDVSHELHVESEPPIYMDSVKCVTASPGPVLRRKLDRDPSEGLDEPDISVQTFGNIPFIDDEDDDERADNTTAVETVLSAENEKQMWKEEAPSADEENENADITSTASVTADKVSPSLHEVDDIKETEKHTSEEEIPFIDEENKNIDHDIPTEMDYFASSVNEQIEENKSECISHLDDMNKNTTDIALDNFVPPISEGDQVDTELHLSTSQSPQEHVEMFNQDPQRE